MKRARQADNDEDERRARRHTAGDVTAAIPDVLFACVAGFLPIADFARAFRIDRRWHFALTPPSQHIALSHVYSLSAPCWKGGVSAHVRRLEVRGADAYGVALALLHIGRGMPRLEHLVLNCEAPHFAWPWIELEFRALRTFRAIFTRDNLGNTAAVVLIAALARAPRLESVDFENSPNFPAYSLVPLERLSSLARIGIAGAITCVEDHALPLTRMPALTDTHLGVVSDACVDALARSTLMWRTFSARLSGATTGMRLTAVLPQLTSLILVVDDMNTDALAPIAPRLTTLQWIGSANPMRHTSGAAMLAGLAKFTRLRSLTLGGVAVIEGDPLHEACNFSATDLRACLRHMPELTNLEVVGVPNVRDLTFLDLPHLSTGLMRFALRRSAARCTASNLDSIIGLRALRTLVLATAFVGNESPAACVMFSSPLRERLMPRLQSVEIVVGSA